MLIKRLRPEESISFDGIKVKNLTVRSIQIGLSSELDPPKGSANTRGPTLATTAVKEIKPAKKVRERERV